MFVWKYIHERPLKRLRRRSRRFVYWRETLNDATLASSAVNAVIARHTVFKAPNVTEFISKNCFSSYVSLYPLWVYAIEMNHRKKVVDTLMTGFAYAWLSSAIGCQLVSRNTNVLDLIIRNCNAYTVFQTLGWNRQTLYSRIVHCTHVMQFHCIFRVYGLVAEHSAEDTRERSSERDHKKKQFIFFFFAVTNNSK